MYISTNKYGRREYIRFTLGPERDIYVLYWETWKSRIGYSARLTYSNDWNLRYRDVETFWSFSREGVRNEIAKYLKHLKQLDSRYLESRQKSR